MSRSIFIAVILGLFTGIPAYAQITYPDAKLPGDVPILFARGLFSDGLSNRDFTISPAGDEIFFTLQQPKFITSTILYMQKENGKWGDIKVAPFSGRFRDLEASFSPDGGTVYFSSDRPVGRAVAKNDFDIWKVTRLARGKYGKPVNLGMIVNSAKDEFYPSVSKNGDLYFTVETAYGKRGEDIVVCKLTGTGYLKPESLPEDINTRFDEFNAFIDPDEQFILFTSYGRADDLGKGDLYISHKDKAGNWLSAKHLPAPINSTATDYCPYVTPDKKYLVFTSNRMSNELTNKALKTYSELKNLLKSPGNGGDDIYWVKFRKDW